MNKQERDRIDWALELAEAALAGSIYRDDGTDWDDNSTPMVELREARKLLTERWQWGWLFRPGSLWLGIHYAAHHKRFCINLLPMVTVWVTKPGGTPPR